jgi:hypothetical protein
MMTTMDLLFDAIDTVDGEGEREGEEEQGAEVTSLRSVLVKDKAKIHKVNFILFFFCGEIFIFIFIFSFNMFYYVFFSLYF